MLLREREWDGYGAWLSCSAAASAEQPGREDDTPCGADQGRGDRDGEGARRQAGRHPSKRSQQRLCRHHQVPGLKPLHCLLASTLDVYLAAVRCRVCVGETARVLSRLGSEAGAWHTGRRRWRDSERRGSGGGVAGRARRGQARGGGEAGGDGGAG
eukprot:2015797-Rhodomonas_salina.1